jgi:hypothetical protein
MNSSTKVRFARRLMKVAKMLLKEAGEDTDIRVMTVANEVAEKIDQLQLKFPEQAEMIVSRIVETMNGGTDRLPILRDAYASRFSQLLSKRLGIEIPSGVSVQSVYIAVCDKLEKFVEPLAQTGSH